MLRVVPLEEATWPSLEALFREGGDPRWCWCQYWRLRSKDFAAEKVPELRERLRSLADRDPAPGLVALEGDGSGARAVGWVSLGPRTDFERIVRSRVIPTIDERPVWSIVCFAVTRSARGTGIGSALLSAAIDYAAAHGATTLEAYPVLPLVDGTFNPDAAFTGTLPMFERAGFVVVADRASEPSATFQRVVVRRDL